METLRPVSTDLLSTSRARDIALDCGARAFPGERGQQRDRQRDRPSDAAEVLLKMTMIVCLLRPAPRACDLLRRGHARNMLRGPARAALPPQ
jgi:hypothetical protein